MSRLSWSRRINWCPAKQDIEIIHARISCIRYLNPSNNSSATKTAKEKGRIYRYKNLRIQLEKDERGLIQYILRIWLNIVHFIYVGNSPTALHHHLANYKKFSKSLGEEAKYSLFCSIRATDCSRATTCLPRHNSQEMEHDSESRITASENEAKLTENHHYKYY